jgi:DNA-binding FadR family transcriptional regulator
LSGNRELIRLFPSMHVHLMRLQLRSIPLVAQSAQFSDYAALNDAILRGQEAEAVAAAECHVQHMKDGIANLPDTMFASEKRAAGTP